jgi:hypothetical protein
VFGVALTRGTQQLPASAMRRPATLTASATLTQRLQAVRNKRRASQLSNATTWAAWIVGLGAILTVVGSSVLSLR